jgi:SAM-dependent methyltransferase
MPAHHDDRSRKATKILSVLDDFQSQLEAPPGILSDFVCLDVGCSRGIITRLLASRCRFTIGVDVDLNHISIDDRQTNPAQDSPEQAVFAYAGGESLPFADASMDLVVCSQVYEHVIDQPGLASEIERVLRPGGICFFSGPNRLAVLEEHYWLPFLSWLPRPLAHGYMRLFRRGKQYDAYPLFYWQIRALWKNFEIHDYTLRMLREPRKFSVSERVEKYPWLRYLPDWAFSWLRPFFPNYNWILVKPA